MLSKVLSFSDLTIQFYLLSTCLYPLGRYIRTYYILRTLIKPKSVKVSLLLKPTQDGILMQSSSGYTTDLLQCFRTAAVLSHLLSGSVYPGYYTFIWASYCVHYAPDTVGACVTLRPQQASKKAFGII